jgi:hypothetical protein
LGAASFWLSGIGLVFALFCLLVTHLGNSDR